MEFIPFGNNCTPADILKVGGLRKHSLPFDWVFAFPDNIKRSLDTDFQEWFDTSLMQSLSGDKNAIKRKWTKHKNYRSQTDDHISGFFNHHDMSDPNTQEMFRRRIDRFKSIIASDEHVIFVTLATPQTIEENGLLNYFDRSGQTTFLYLNWIQDDNYQAVIDGPNNISYWSPKQFDPRIGAIVSNEIKRLFDIPAKF